MNGYTTFRAYRYQLMPLDRNETKDMYNELTAAEIINRKNEFFAESLNLLPRVRHRKSEILIDVKSLGKDVFSIHLAPSRPLTRETSQSNLEKVENWPHITAFILNKPNEQYLLIQDRVAAFANTDAVSNLVKVGTRHALEKLGLSLHIEPLFESAYFWDLIEEYRNRVVMVEFEFITPNMSNISRTLSESLKSLGKDTNAVREDLAITSDPAVSLDISPSNETIQGLVEYTSEGGGDITVKVKGIRKRFHTSKSSREVNLSGLEITASPEQIIAVIREALR